MPSGYHVNEIAVGYGALKKLLISVMLSSSVLNLRFRGTQILLGILAKHAV